MASFFVELWESIFTPGPTPTILIATNATFACLQVTLLALLYATYSIHFLVLSVLCVGLWWSINWFAAELLIAQQEEQRRKKKREQDYNVDQDGKSIDTGGALDTSSRIGDGDGGSAKASDADSDTEVEDGPIGKSATPGSSRASRTEAKVKKSPVETIPQEDREELRRRGGAGGGAARDETSSSHGAVGAGLGTGVEEDDGVSDRGPGTQSSVSTEDEWEKISESGKDK